MTREASIVEKVKEKFKPIHIEIENESHKHAHGGTETHFKLLVVSKVFVGMSRLQRQRTIYALLKDEMQAGLHALAQRALTPEEWAAQDKEKSSDFLSPPCHHLK